MSGRFALPSFPTLKCGWPVLLDGPRIRMVRFLIHRKSFSNLPRSEEARLPRLRGREVERTPGSGCRRGWGVPDRTSARG